MTIFDIFKKKKAVRREKPVPKQEKPAVREPKLSKVGSVAPRAKKITDQAYRILKSPHVTEKAGDLTLKNQYVFEVFPGAKKFEIKRAVEDIYGIDVVSVKIVNVPKKKRRLGRIQGWRKGYKKTIVRVKEGQKIEVLPR